MPSTSEPTVNRAPKPKQARKIVWSVSTRLCQGYYAARQPKVAPNLSESVAHMTWPRQRVIGWTLLGVSAAAAELGLLRLLVEGVAVPLPIATAVAAETLIVVKFLLNDRFVFGHPRPALDRAVKYHGACAGALVVYWLVINALAALLGVPYAVGFVIGTAASFVWSLFTNFLWVWDRAGVRP
jgi:putative flippase GtrA